MENFDNYEEELLEKLLNPEEEIKKEPKEFDGIMRGIIPLDRVKNIERIENETNKIDSLLNERDYFGLEKTTAEINGREYPCWTFQMNNQAYSITLFQDRWNLQTSQGDFKSLSQWGYRDVDSLFNLIDNHLDKNEDQELTVSKEEFNKIKNYSVFNKEIERIEKLEPEVGLDMRKEANALLNKDTDNDKFKWIFEDYLEDFKGKYRDPYEEYMKSQEEAQKVKIDQIKVENEVLDRVMFKTVEKDEEVQHMILTEPESYSDERKALTYTSKEDEIIKEEKSVNQILEEIKNKNLENLNEIEQQEMDQIINQEVNPKAEKTKHITEREKNFDRWLELKESYDFHRYNVGTEEYEIPSYTFKLGNTLMCVVEGKEGSLLYQAENGDFDKLKVEIYEDNDKMFKEIENFQAKGNNPQEINYYPQQMSNYVKVDAALKFVQEEDHELWNELHEEAVKELDGNEEHEKGFFVRFNEKLEQFKDTLHEKYENAKLWYIQNSDRIHKTIAVGFGIAILTLPLPTEAIEKEKQFCQFTVPEKSLPEPGPTLEQGGTVVMDEQQLYEVDNSIDRNYTPANEFRDDSLTSKETEHTPIQSESLSQDKWEQVAPDKVVVEKEELENGVIIEEEITFEEDVEIKDIIEENTKPSESIDQTIQDEIQNIEQEQEQIQQEIDKIESQEQDKEVEIEHGEVTEEMTEDIDRIEIEDTQTRY